jgi:hypothetical protein
MVENLDFIVLNATNAVFVFLVFGVSELDDPNIILYFYFFDVVDIPPVFAFVDKILNDIFVGSFLIEVLDVNKHG